MDKQEEKDSTQISLFEQKTVRRAWHNEEWYFSIIDVIEVLTDSERPRKYWNDLKTKLQAEGFHEVSEKIGQLKMTAKDGKLRGTDAADTRTLLRIIQSVPSPKAEPFKRWLAEVGKNRLDEIENPELMMERMKIIYEQKGYPKDWIEKRVRGIAVRNELTDEWNQWGASRGRDYAILTNEISLATFGLEVKEYKEYKRLERNHNLRDHMTDLELILTMLGEATSTTLHRTRDSLGMKELTEDARDAGEVAGNARKDIEQKSKKKVISRANYLKGNKTLE